MRYIEKDLGELDHAYIIPIADLHVGDENFNEKKFLKMIEFIKSNENVYVMLLGDLINNAIVGSVSDIYGEIKTPSQAKKYVIDMFYPIRHRILGMVKGNHENRTKKLVDYDITEDIATSLGVPYGKESLFINVKIGGNHQGRFSYTIFAHHGNGGGSKPGGKANSVYNANQIIVADLYITAHVHQMLTFPDTIFIPDVRHRRLVQMKRQYVICGSYSEWGGYAEGMMLAPAKTGAPRIRLAGTGKKDFHVSI